MTNAAHNAALQNAGNRIFAVAANANGGDDPSRFSARVLEHARHDARRLRAIIQHATDLLDEIATENTDREPSGATEAPSALNTPLLSDRETEVMTWVVEGKSNGVIATILGISPHTVDTHLRRAFQKLDTTSRTVAAVRAMQGRLIRSN